MGVDSSADGVRHVRDREVLEERWRAIGVDGHIVTCSIHRVDGPGLEVRVGYSTGDWQRIRHVANLAEGRELAETWRQLALSRGLTELSV